MSDSKPASDRDPEEEEPHWRDSWRPGDKAQESAEEKEPGAKHTTDRHEKFIGPKEV